jgi:heme exporter protein A
MHVLDIKDLSCIRQDRVLFKNLSFSVKSGNCMHILGPNASGKSSLLQMLCQLLKPSSGDIYWNNETLKANKSNFILNLNYLGHKLGVKSELSVIENIHFMAKLAQQDSTSVRIEEALNLWGLQQLKHQKLQYLSAGQKQRLALTKLLIKPAKLWLLDEPYTSLDQSYTQVLTQLITQHLQQQGLVILTSHQAIPLEPDLLKTLNLATTSHV